MGALPSTRREDQLPHGLPCCSRPRIGTGSPPRLGGGRDPRVLCKHLHTSYFPLHREAGLPAPPQAGQLSVLLRGPRHGWYADKPAAQHRVGTSAVVVESHEKPQRRVCLTPQPPFRVQRKPFGLTRISHHLISFLRALCSGCASPQMLHVYCHFSS